MPDREVSVSEIPQTVVPSQLGPAPGLVIVPSIFGVTPDLVGQMNQLSDVGVIVAIDPFFRIDPGPLAFTEIQRGLTRMRKIDQGRAVADLKSVVEQVRARPDCTGKVAALGICFGGKIGWLAAADGAVDAAAAWHGSGIGALLDRARDITVPLSLHFGDADASIPVVEVEAIRKALAGRDDVEVALHPGAAHGFSQPGSRHYAPAAYQAAMDGVRRLLAALA